MARTSDIVIIFMGSLYCNSIGIPNDSKHVCYHELVIII